jgi:hypothetical protein
MGRRRERNISYGTLGLEVGARKMNFRGKKSTAADEKLMGLIALKLKASDG